MANAQRPPRRLFALAALALVGVGLSVSLTHQYYQVRSGSAGFRSFCNYGSAMNCDLVAASPYAELFAGIPLSSFAAGWLLATFFVTLLAMSAGWRREGTRILLAMTGLGVLFSLSYLYVMAGVLGTYCLFCLLLDAVNIASFLIAATLFRDIRKGEPADLGKWKVAAGIVAASLVVSIAVLKEMESRPMSTAQAREMAQSLLQAQPVAVGAGPEFPSMGPADAPVTIVEFSDFQCPHCRAGAMILHTVQSRYPTQVRVVLRNFPLDPACNPLVQHSMHPVACQAAKVAVCAHQQGRFAPVYEVMFEKQAQLAALKPLELAVSEGGADPAQLNACVASDQTAAAISRDIEEAKRLGIQSTPTFFINGIKIEGAYPAPVWNLMIDALLEKTGK